jgi:hypothetical protein
MRDLPKTLPPPNLPKSLDSSAKWLAGEGAGSWFVIRPVNRNRYIVARFSPVGLPECQGTFVSQRVLKIQDTYKMSYPSHCMEVTVEQRGKIIHLHAI